MSHSVSWEKYEKDDKKEHLIFNISFFFTFTAENIYHLIFFFPGYLAIRIKRTELRSNLTKVRN